MTEPKKKPTKVEAAIAKREDAKKKPAAKK
jgi:hypothetical protein